MKNLWVVLFFAPALLLAQAGEGVRFEEGLTWQQVVKKARQQNKYIFVDAYATWCGPCKKMEKEVFSLKNVGDYMNDRFISVRAQMDTSKNDDAQTKNWYKDAHDLQVKYKVVAFPTYLFFSPEGKVVHRYTAALPDSLFLRIAGNALNPDKQYYTLLEQYRNGKRDYAKLPALANFARESGENVVAKEIAKDYIQNYLSRLADSELLQKKYLDFANRFSSQLTYRDKVFQYVNENRKKVDELMGEDFSKNMIVAVIHKEVISTLYPNGKPLEGRPDWSKITQAIAGKYDKYYTDFAISFEQIDWYKKKKDKQQQIKYVVKRYDTYGLDTAGIGYAFVNNDCYNLIFKYCNDKDTLSKAVGWMGMILKNHPEDYVSMDTYANLLHKVGRTNEAITWQEKAWQMETTAAKKEAREPDASIKEALDKMKKGEPTWKKS